MTQPPYGSAPWYQQQANTPGTTEWFKTNHPPTPHPHTYTPLGTGVAVYAANSTVYSLVLGEPGTNEKAAVTTSDLAPGSYEIVARERYILKTHELAMTQVRVVVPQRGYVCLQYHPPAYAGSRLLAAVFGSAELAVLTGNGRPASLEIRGVWIGPLEPGVPPVPPPGMFDKKYWHPYTGT